MERLLQCLLLFVSHGNYVSQVRFVEGLLRWLCPIKLLETASFQSSDCDAVSVSFNRVSQDIQFTGLRCCLFPIKVCEPGQGFAVLFVPHQSV